MAFLRLWKTPGNGPAAPEMPGKRVSKRHQRATTRKTSQRRDGVPKRGGGAFPEIISTLGLLSMLTAYLQAEKRRGQGMRQFVRQRQKNQLAQ